LKSVETEDSPLSVPLHGAGNRAVGLVAVRIGGG
jgi:hypothetical protein